MLSYCSCTQHSFEVCTKRLSFIVWPSSCSSVDVITAQPKAITFTNLYRREFSGCLSNGLHSFWKLFLCCNLLVRWSLISNFLRKIYQDLILADPLYKEPWKRGCQNFLVWWRVWLKVCWRRQWLCLSDVSGIFCNNHISNAQYATNKVRLIF